MYDSELKILIDKAIGGDSDAFSALICRVQNKAYSIAFRYMNSDYDARDMMQESFIKMYRNLDKFNFESAFDTWYFRILINCCLDELRKRKNKESYSLDIIPDGKDEPMAVDIPDESPGPEAELISKERQKLVREAILALPEDHRNIIILRELEQLSYDEIGQTLDLDPGTVKSRLSRARQKLKQIILEQNPDIRV
ncbi:MAG: sigma-70 family RNA polymerase sigma factor [Clostridia bacterium]|nr:sigma-70 family RNA polymerase sigma factor [Clostridia bacterium]